ncbi:MAG TPA: hypothetical protein VG452_07830, partial [Egibacteraceae bacterium]|nr:hypothetical protein [Egibacteraceae bacterium]
MSPRLSALAVTAALVAGCSAGAPLAGPPTSDHDAVRGARAALGEPMVGLARSLLRAASRLDGARHELPRGQAMRDAVAAASGDAAALRAAADAAAQAAGSVAGDPAAGGLPAVAEATGLVTDAAAGAHEAAVAA